MLDRSALLLAVLVSFSVTGCGDDRKGNGDGDGSGGSGASGTTSNTNPACSCGDGTCDAACSEDAASCADDCASATAVCTEPTPVACSDQVLLEMNLQSDIAPGAIANEPEADGWTSAIDATAGGAFASDPDSYVYGRFTDAGLSKVDISDEQAIESMDWDIAFRRYVVRVNSLFSGPSCVTAARVAGDPAFEDVTVVPEGLTLRGDDYFTDSCDIIPDGSGLEGSPATALSGYWTYPGCVQMTNRVFVVELADGRHLKLQVSSYYAPAVQEQCDATGSVPQSGTGSANFLVRWAFLP